GGESDPGRLPLTVLAFAHAANRGDVGTVAEVHFVQVAASAGVVAVVALHTHVLEGLVDAAEGTADVFQFAVDVDGNLGEADHHRKDGDRRDEDQFGGDDESG